MREIIYGCYDIEVPDIEVPDPSKDIEVPATLYVALLRTYY